jgi:hypothetical protein
MSLITQIPIEVYLVQHCQLVLINYSIVNKAKNPNTNNKKVLYLVLTYLATLTGRTTFVFVSVVALISRW